MSVKMRVMVIGSGGREHVICEKIAQSPSVEKVYWVGTAPKPELEKIKVIWDINVTDFEGLANFALQEKISFTVVGPELPLTLGIVDYFEEKNLAIFGPTKKAAKLEGSKTFAKEIMRGENVPTAEYTRVDSLEHGCNLMDSLGLPLVFKVDGLAAGKGVIIVEDKNTGKEELQKLMESHPDQKIFAEEFLQGRELSFMVVVSKNKAFPLVPAQDYKRVYEQDEGPNTGGMGAFASSDLIDESLKKEIMDTIINPTLQGLQKRNIEFTGVLYAGLMVTNKGPKVLEYNTRFGDPETQAILHLIDEDLALLIKSCINGEIVQPKISQKKAITLVLAMDGYPGKYPKGIEITKCKIKDCRLYHSGTTYQQGKLLTNGGRVLNIVGIANELSIARDMVYKDVKNIDFEGIMFRRDIGWGIDKSERNKDN
ncbi:phosphoribosylamine--glycine ligase [Proteinivorax tanatarense]|uniref:Phosphoribosylamine--glycine ligase n=1 Tax=Proteinivorax tanatarense TaxID=1260629 RepID=A0AAU7VKE4_9FIRM